MLRHRCAAVAAPSIVRLRRGWISSVHPMRTASTGRCRLLVHLYGSSMAGGTTDEGRAEASGGDSAGSSERVVAGRDGAGAPCTTRRGGPASLGDRERIDLVAELERLQGQCIGPGPDPMRSASHERQEVRGMPCTMAALTEQGSSDRHACGDTRGLKREVCPCEWDGTKSH